MESIAEKINRAKRRALVEWLQGEYWHDITYEKYEAIQIKSLLEEQAKQVQRKEKENDTGTD